MLTIIKGTLENYLKEFYGYGNLDSDIWFIGKEEAGGESKKDIEARMKAWEECNQGEVIDVYEFHKKAFNLKDPQTSKANLDKLFNYKVKGFNLQRTWLGLIKLVVALDQTNNGVLNRSQIKEFQSKFLGRLDSNNCMLELFPVSSRSIKEFHVSEWYDLDYLKDRDTYKKELGDLRVKKIKELIQQHNPKVVVFYSTDKEYLDYWQMIVGISFSEDSKIHLHKKHTVHIKKRENTVYVVTPHPTAFGITNNFWIELGKKIKNEGFPQT